MSLGVSPSRISHCISFRCDLLMACRHGLSPTVSTRPRPFTAYHATANTSAQNPHPPHLDVYPAAIVPCEYSTDDCSWTGFHSTLNDTRATLPLHCARRFLDHTKKKAISSFPSDKANVNDETQHLLFYFG